MADDGNREEKLAAGLRKFKQYQQRSTKLKNGKKKSPPPINDSSLTGAENRHARGTPAQSPPERNEYKVPSANQNSKCDLDSSKSKSSSNTVLNEHVCSSELTESSSEASFSSGSALKSKSDLDLPNVKELSSTESLRQISLQVNGLMSETDAFMNGSLDEDGPSDLENKSLEQRNQELAILVNNLRQANDQLQFQQQELKAKNKRLSQTFEQEKQALLEKSHKEQVSLKDQLQVHIQTIGILVAEKTELQSSLSLSQQTAKQKAGEVEELQGRLRASRQRASDLERELITLNNSNQHLEKASKETAKEIEKIKLDSYKLSKANEELRCANAELSEKLNKKVSDFQELEKELAECRTKLVSAEVQVKQLSQNPDNPGQLEEVYQQKFELEKRISLHKESIDKLINERDQMSEQYQQYIQQLSQQVTSLRDEIRQLSSEKDAISKDRNVYQEKLEALQHSQDSSNYEDASELKLRINILEDQKEELNTKLEAEVSKNNNLIQKMAEQEERMAELEVFVARLKQDQVDQSRLVETMQSDKVAASRAVAQNRELKKQLEELQSGFVDMSNTKLELAEKLHSEQHITKELGERLSQQEEELHELKDQLTQREAELQNLHKSNTKGVYQQNQIADRMRHYEAQGQLAEMLQKELHQAQEQIKSLVQQNSELRMAIATQAEVTVSDENQKEDKDATKRNDLVASLSASVRQLEMERNQMMKQLEEQKGSRKSLEEQLKKSVLQFNDDGETGDIVSNEKYRVLKNAMEQLEERFKQTMNRIAELSDERQQLEHLVMQLQGETDTIGDYIALYQIQRGLMRKRASEKDEYIAQLARDREDLKAKLGELQNLVMRLLEERKQFQSQGNMLNQNLDYIQMSDVCDVSNSHYGDSVDNPPAPESDVSSEFSSDVYAAKKPEATARKIMDLLTEIESTNLVEKPCLDNFHPCPVCSGRLITV